MALISETVGGLTVLGGVPSSSSGGTTDHTQLTNLNVADQHAIQVVTGLQSALDAKADSTTLSEHLAAENPHLITAALINTMTSAEITAAISSAINGVVNGASEAFDTLQEIQTAIEEGDTEVSALLSTVTSTQTALSEHVGAVSDAHAMSAITGLVDALTAKVSTAVFEAHTHAAAAITVDTSGFAGNLAGITANMQAALAAIDAFNLGIATVGSDDVEIDSTAFSGNLAGTATDLTTLLANLDSLRIGNVKCGAAETVFPTALNGPSLRLINTTGDYSAADDGLYFDNGSALIPLSTSGGLVTRVVTTLDGVTALYNGEEIRRIAGDEYDGSYYRDNANSRWIQTFCVTNGVADTVDGVAVLLKADVTDREIFYNGYRL